MIKFLLLNLVLFSAGASWARGGDLVNNGGGISEKNVLYAYEKLGKYLKSCQESEACKLSDDQKTMLQKIQQGLPQDQHSKQLNFLSEKKNRGTFLIDGNIRVAKTGSAIGSPIQINVDLLYSKTSSGSYDATTVPEAVAILVHEFGHHYGNWSHEELDLLGVKISLFLQRKIISTPLIPWKSDISASVINHEAVLSFPEVLLNVGDDIIDISEAYRNTVKCWIARVPIPILNLRDIPIAQESPLGSVLHNVHWEKIKDKENTLEIQIVGNISNTCKSRADEKIRSNDSQLSMKFRVNKNGDTWIYDPNSLNLQQVSNPWWKFIKLPFL